MKKLHENLFVSGQLQAQDFPDLAKQGITTIINNRPDNEESGQLRQQEASKLAQQNGIAYHYLPMANGQPLPEDLVTSFAAVLKASEGPVLAHCRSGMRSSFIWALGVIPEGTVTVDEAIEAASNAGIPLNNARAVLESVAPE